LKRNLHIVVSALIACSFAISAARVSASTHSNATAKPPKLAKNVTLSIWDFFGAAKDDAERATLKQVVAGWEKKTGNHVNFLGHPDNSNGKFLVAAPTGNAPDLIGVPHDQVTNLVTGKVVSPVPDWAFGPSIRSQYAKGAIQAVMLNGKPYSMPWAVETSGIFYNKAMVPASTFKPAKGNKYFTWAQLIKKAKSLNGNGKYGYLQKLNDLYFEYAFISGNGGYVFKYGKKGFDYRNIGLNNKGAVKGITFVKDLTDKGKYNLMPATTTYDTMVGLFEAGRAGMMLNGPWIESDLKKNNIDFGFVPVPSFDGKHAAHPFSGMQVYSVNAFSKHKNEAFSLLQYMTQNMQLAEFKTSGRIPVFKKVLASKTIQSDPVARGLAGAALTASPMPPIPELGTVWTPMANAFDDVVKGKSTPAEAARAAVTKIKSDIAAAHGG
jgi:arabinogalactan oligomer/maltooligosaccharide transport system substrate-binding protein